MYLAPLNYDRFFKKVFSDLKIAKRFLEDFLDEEIQEIEFLPSRNKITDDAQIVEFDFRCKILDNYVIIEMQQWYKPDVIQRFYVYHALGAALQLEHMPKKVIPLPNGKTRKIHDYGELLPTITIIWMVHDTFGFTDDYINYVLTPDYISDFIKDASMWHNKNIDALIETRKHLYDVLTNPEKDIEFLSSNKLIYVFQKNIVKNKLHSKYFDWFDLAEKTLKKISEKFAYDKYIKDEILSEVVRRLKIGLGEEGSETYIKDYEEYLEGVRRYDTGIERKVKQRIEKKIEQEIELKFENKLSDERQRKEKAKAREEKAKAREKEAIEREKETEKALDKAIIQLWKNGMIEEQISKMLNLSIKYIQQIILAIKNN